MDMSEHPYEEEVLLSEGMSFVVKSVDLKEHLTEVEGKPGKKENYYLINLQCFDKKADKTVYWLTFFSMLVGNPISVFKKAFRARKHGTLYRKSMCYLILIINAFIMLTILALFYFTILDLLLAYQNSQKVNFALLTVGILVSVPYLLSALLDGIRFCSCRRSN